MRPARRVLFTVLPREYKYKAHEFIDRGLVIAAGDQVLGAWSYKQIKQKKKKKCSDSLASD